MKKNEIKTGGIYSAKISNIICDVRVDKIREISYLGKPATRYDVTNLRTGRKTTFNSAAKFRGEVKSCDRCDGTGTCDEDGERFACPDCDGTGEVESKTEEAKVKPPFSEKPNGSMSLISKDGLQEAPDESSTQEESASVSSAEPSDSSAIDLEAPLCPASEAQGSPSEGFKPTPEQEAILEIGQELEGAKAEGQRVLVIGAGAGAGKTSTLKLIEKVLKGNGQYTAFNSSLCAESKSKFTKCAVNTTHSLAFREVGRRYSHRLKGNRVKSYQIARMLGIEDFYATVEDASGSPHVKRLVAGWLAGKLMKAISKFCQSADPEITVKHFPYIDGIDSTKEGKRTFDNNNRVKEYLLPFAQTAWADLTSVEGTMPFSHDVYVKLWQLGQGPDRPVIASDYILLDEAQDTAPVMLDILKQQKHALLILVGDDNQQIYEWRGAVNAMAAFRGSPRKLLSQSFRFGQSVADVANSILAGLEEKTDLVMKGFEKIPSRICEVAQPRCYLFRTNAGAVGRLMQAQAEGKRGHLIGGSKEVLDFCKAAIDLQTGKGTSHPDLGSFSKWAEVVAYSKEDEGEDLRLMVKLIEQFGAAKIHEALENMPSEQDADLVLSTAHRSKGREWSSVKIGPDFPTANKLGDADRRLLYVACTRAQEELDITNCPTFCGGYAKPFEKNAKWETDEGNWIPGIRIKYTAPMPTEEELAEYSKGRKVEVKPVSAPLPPSQDAPLTYGQANGSSKAGEEFTWANVDGQWCVRGPLGFMSKTVTVIRKNGTKSQETLRSLVKESGNLCFYGIAKSGR